jgi:UDP-galactopyranose mutase
LYHQHGKNYKEKITTACIKICISLKKKKLVKDKNNIIHKYDYLIVGSGLYGATFAYLAKQRGKQCLVIDKRKQSGGNLYCENIEGINVHKYGAHIFHTSNKQVWDFVNSFVEFNRYTNSPIANYKGELYNLPFNMNTFYKLWGTKTPEDAKVKIEEQKEQFGVENPQNLEEQAISLVGIDIYEKLIKGYTEKQWGRKCTELPAFIIKRLPVRFIFDNNYFDDKYQGIPIGGYNKLIEGLLNGTEIKTNCNFIENRYELSNIANKIIYTGMIDEYYDYCFGHLEYRTLRFEEQIIDKSNYQGNAVVNFTDSETPYTRIIEHKYFEFGLQPKTVITKEYSSEWAEGSEPYYPINNKRNMILYEKYNELTSNGGNVIFGGRLGEYKYYNMDGIIERLLNKCI